jgi:hypothetical protein
MEHAQLLSLFAKVNREKIRPALEKQLLEVEEAIEKIKGIENKLVSKIDERPRDRETNHNK